MSTETYDEVAPFPDEPATVPWTMIHDWTYYVPISHQARTLYGIFRSMMSDNEKDPDAGTRKITDDRVRVLLGLAEGTKIPSRSTLYRIRAELVEADLIRIKDIPGRGKSPGTLKIVSRVYFVRRLPPPGILHFPSTWGLLKKLDQLEEKGLSPAKMQSVSNLTQALRDLETGSVSNLGHVVPKLTRSGGSELGPGPPIKNPPSNNPSSSSGSSAAGRRGRARMTSDDDDKMTSQKRTQQTKTMKSDKKDEPDTMPVEHPYAAAAADLANELPGRPDAAQVASLVPLLCAALDRGWAPSALKSYLASKCNLERVTSPGAVHLRNAALIPDPVGVDRKGAEIELCPRCDEYGFTDDPGCATGDPLGDSSLCLHGADDPWDDPEHRAQQEEIRQNALNASLRAQEDARRTQEAQERREAVEAAHRAGRRAVRIRDAKEFLKSAAPMGDPDANTVRTALLDNDDPASMDELDILVGLALGLLDSGVPMEKITFLIFSTPQEDRHGVLVENIPEDAVA